jgi:hypothetical protein
MLSYRLKVSSPYSPENALIPTKSENLKEPPPSSVWRAGWSAWAAQNSVFPISPVRSVFH